jgi:hypothetical protein
MLTTLSTVKSRLAIDADPQYDTLLTNAIRAVSARFDKETHRILARTVDFQQEFDPADTEILVTCYPIETVTKFELKTSEAAGWQEQSPAPDFLIRKGCIISLTAPLNFQPSTFNLQLARVTYSGGYVLPGTTPTSGQTPLPDDLEQAAVEQVAYWFQAREKLGLKSTWPHFGTYEQFFGLDLLQSVQSVLRSHQRWSL